MKKRDGCFYETTAVSLWCEPISIDIVIGIFFITMLNLIDAFITMYLVFFFDAQEINPFMRILLVNGPFSFFLVKYLIAAAAIILIGVYSHKCRGAYQVSFYTILLVYLTVAVYQLVLLGMVI